MDSYRLFSPELDHSPSITGYYSPTSMAFRPSIGSYGNSMGAVHRQGQMLSGLAIDGMAGVSDIPSNLGLNVSTMLTLLGSAGLAYSSLKMKGGSKKKKQLKMASQVGSAAAVVAGIYGLAS